MKTRIVVKPLTPALWPDLEALFGDNGACAGCWCMFWRLEVGERFDELKGPAAKRRFKALVMSGRAKGFLAYVDGEAIGWLSVGRRVEFAKLDRAPSLRCDDAEDVHALPCFFVKRGFRSQGVATTLLNAAVLALKKAGAHVLEGYPMPAPKKLADAFIYTGTVPLFEKAGFKIVQFKPVGKQRVRLRLSK